jgi:hypothetical protein
VIWELVSEILFFWVTWGEPRDEPPRGCLPLLISLLFWGGVTLLVGAGLLALFG